MKTYLRLLILLLLLAFVLPPEQLLAQNKAKTQTWTGVVVDMNGEPIPGVAVFTSEGGGITDEKGAFQINATADTDIQFSCLGYESLTIKAGSQQLKRVVMKDDSQLLETAVVTALGIKRDEKAIG